MKGWGGGRYGMGRGFWAKRQEQLYPTAPHSCPPRLLAQRQRHSFGLRGVACVGTEAHLSLCSLEFYRANDTTRCPGGAPAVVSCVPGPLFAASSGQKKQQQSKPQGEVCVTLTVTFPTPGGEAPSLLTP